MDDVVVRVRRSTTLSAAAEPCCRVLFVVRRAVLALGAHGHERDRKVRDGDAQERDAAAGHRVGRHQSVEGEMVPRMVPGTPEERGFFTNAEFAMP